MPALTPGRLITLDDGTECIVTRADQIPKRWLQKCRAVGHVSLFVVSNWDGTKWRFHDDPPPHPYYRGGYSLNNEFNEPTRYAICVPAAFFEPEKNEFGEVSP